VCVSGVIRRLLTVWYESYFAILAILNLILTFGLYSWANVMSYTFDQLLEGKSLPPAAQLTLSHPWWPCIFAALFAAAWVASQKEKLGERAELHIVASGLIVEISLIFWNMLSAAIPFVPMQSRLIP
jgi:hypothetical protein